LLQSDDLVSVDEASFFLGDVRLRLLIGRADWMTRTDYLGGPIRIAGVLAVLPPGILARGGLWVAALGLALAALLSWILATKARQPRSRAAALRTPAPWLAVLLAAHSIATGGSAMALTAAFAISVLSAAAWWRLERRRASLLAAVGASR
jgi:hypothetical protein